MRIPPRHLQGVNRFLAISRESVAAWSACEMVSAEYILNLGRCFGFYIKRTLDIGCPQVYASTQLRRDRMAIPPQRLYIRPLFFIHLFFKTASIFPKIRKKIKIIFGEKSTPILAGKLKCRFFFLVSTIHVSIKQCCHISIFK